MTKRADLSTRLSYALAWVHGKTDLAPVAGVILGSGLGDFASRLARAVTIPYEEIPYFPVSRVPAPRTIGWSGNIGGSDLCIAPKPMMVPPCNT